LHCPSVTGSTTIPHLTRSSLHRCLQRHGISRLPEVAGDKWPKKEFRTYPIGYFHIDIARRPVEVVMLVRPMRHHRPSGVVIASTPLSAIAADVQPASGEITVIGNRARLAAVAGKPGCQ